MKCNSPYIIKNVKITVYNVKRVCLIYGYDHSKIFKHNLKIAIKKFLKRQVITGIVVREDMIQLDNLFFLISFKNINDMTRLNIWHGVNTIIEKDNKYKNADIEKDLQELRL